MKSFNKKSKHPRKLKETLLRSFLIISIICCVFLVSNCDQLINLFGPGLGNSGGTSNPPEFGGSESSSFATALFKSAAKGAAGQIGGAAASWAMSSIGLSNGSPDYTAQLNKIDNDLQTIINQLNGIQNELDNINSSIQALTCSGWQETLQTDITYIESYWEDYYTYVATASDSTKKVPDTIISGWVDKLLKGDQNNTTIEDILSSLEKSLVLPDGSGALASCIKAIDPGEYPGEHSFGTDTTYYNLVDNYRDYYFIYEVKALFLYGEAEHYMAWVAAGKPTSNSLSADSVSYVCSNANAAVYCNLVATRTNALYNALIDQFTIAGAPYTDENFIAEYRYQASGSLLWPKSLEDFTTAGGSSCADPLTSGNPCGITAGFYDQDQTDLKAVTYKGYTGWQTAGSAALQQLLAGWKSGTAGNYLQNKLGFQNMKNKVIISTDVEQITLNETYQTQYVIPFFDTDFDYNWFPNDPGQPVIDEFQYRSGVMYKNRNDYDVGGCNYGTEDKVIVDYYINPYVENLSRNGFYNCHGHMRFCTGPTSDEIYWYDTFAWSVLPGWLASNDGQVNHEPSAKQFRWPVLLVSHIPCTDNRSHTDVNGIWSMCGDDFTAYIDFNVPRPETCDDPGAGVACSNTAQSVANAKSIFGNNSKSRRSF